MTAAPYPPYRGDEPCTTGDPDRFFPIQGDYKAAAAAKAECEPCPLIRECREWALAHGEAGIWGGTSNEDRKYIRRERGITVTPVDAPFLDREQVMRMVRRGTPNEVIAQILHADRRVVTRIVREHSGAVV